MKSILLLVSLIMATEAFGGLPPTSLKGQSGAKATTFNFEVPHNQSTKTATGGLVESGNKNRLVNPGFEATTVNSGWTSNVTSTALATISTESAAPIEGKKSLIYSCAGGASGGTCTLSQDVATAYALQGLASIFIESDSPTGVKFYNRVNGANSLSIPVDTITASIRKIPFVLGTTSSGLAVEITVSAAQTIEVLLDEGFVGAQDVKQDVDQSRIAGESYFAGTASCDWPRNSATVGSFTATAACPGPTIVNSAMGTWATTDSNLPKQTITNLPSGKYKATFTFASGAGATSRNVAAITDGTTTCEPVEVEQSTSLNGSTVSCSFTYTSSGDRNFELVGASNTSTIYIYNGQTAPRASVKFQLEYFGSGSIYSSTNADTDWASCGHTTSSFTGFGTVTNIETQCKRQGGDLLMKGKFTSGTSTAVEARLALALNGVALTSKGVSVIPSLQLAGNGTRGVSDATQYMTLIEPSVTYLTIGGQNTGSPGVIKLNGSSILASGNLFSFNARIPINGWEQSNVIIANLSGLESCTDSYECTDEFTAYVDSAGVVSNENIDWINGNCTVTSTSTYTCPYKTGLVGGGVSLANVMNCTTTVNSGANYDSTLVSSTNAQAVFRIKDSGTGAAFALGQVISCQKQGADYIGKTGKVVASDQNLRTPGLNNAIFISAEISSAGVVSQEDSDFINGSCAVTDTSLYTCTWNTSYWSSAPKCIPNVTNGSQNFKAEKEAIPTTTSGVFRTANSTTGGKAASGFTLMCHGVKQ